MQQVNTLYEVYSFLSFFRTTGPARFCHVFNPHSTGFFVDNLSRPRLCKALSPFDISLAADFLRRSLTLCVFYPQQLLLLPVEYQRCSSEITLSCLLPPMYPTFTAVCTERCEVCLYSTVGYIAATVACTIIEIIATSLILYWQQFKLSPPSGFSGQLYQLQILPYV